MPGDCGSWVIDPVSGNIYGMIIATAPEVQESYMIPAYQVHDSIKSRLPTATTVGFPTTNDDGIVRTMNILASPRSSSMPSTKGVDRSKAGGSHPKERTISTKDRIPGFLEWYCFYKGGEDWNVARRRMIRDVQTELKEKADRRFQSSSKVSEQMTAMNALRREQIDRLVEQRKRFWEMEQDSLYSWERQPVSISIMMVETRTSREKLQNNKKVVEVISFDIIISISGHWTISTRRDGSHWLSDETCDLRLPVSGGKLGIAVGEGQKRSLVDVSPQKEDKQLVRRGSEGQIDDPFAEKEIFSRDGKPTDLSIPGLASLISTKSTTPAAHYRARKNELYDVADELSRSKADPTAREVDHDVSQHLEDLRLVEDTKKAFELSVVSARNQLDGGTEQHELGNASNRKGGKMVVYDKDSGYDTSKQRAKSKGSNWVARYDSDDSWDTESDAERIPISPKPTRRRSDRAERGDLERVILYAPPERRSSSHYYREHHRRRSPIYDGGVGIHDPSRQDHSAQISHSTSRPRNQRGASPGRRDLWH